MVKNQNNFFTGKWSDIMYWEIFDKTDLLLEICPLAIVSLLASIFDWKSSHLNTGKQTLGHWKVLKFTCRVFTPCPIRSDRQTTSLTLTTGAPYSCTNGRGCEQHEYSLERHRFSDCSVEVTLRSDCLGCLNWPGRRGVLNSQHIYVISAGSRQLDRWRWIFMEGFI